MRLASALLTGTLLAAPALPSSAAEVRSAAPDAMAVTVYRAPDRSRALSLDDLQGFALISETRRVALPAGDSTLRFEGVAGGIQTASAIVTGLPDGVLEKNRDARLLSPGALVAASLHREVELERTDPKTGEVTRLRGTIESDAGGVVFRSAQGIEALRCAGLPETFDFEPFAGAQAVPTLSVRVRSAVPVTRTVTLSYLAGGFDWAATYTARLSDDGATLNLGAWVTLANGNGESFPAAQVQLVAGRLNRETPDDGPDASAGPILAECWPRGSTSDGTPLPVPPPPRAEAAAPLMLMRSFAMASTATQARVVVTAQRVTQEQLGDLKLYRVPDRTRVSGRQMKQVRLMDQPGVPVRDVFVVRLSPGDRADETAVSRVSHELRTRNTPANHLGLPLPAGDVAVYTERDGVPVLLSEGQWRDHTLGEALILGLGAAPDLTVRSAREQRAIDPAGAAVLPLLPGVSLRSVAVVTPWHVELSSALRRAADVEVGIDLPDGMQVVRADRPMQRADGRPTFSVRVPAGGRATLRYATAHTVDTLIRAH